MTCALPFPDPVGCDLWQHEGQLAYAERLRSYLASLIDSHGLRGLGLMTLVVVPQRGVPRPQLELVTAQHLASELGCNNWEHVLRVYAQALPRFAEDRSAFAAFHICPGHVQAAKENEPEPSVDEVKASGRFGIFLVLESKDLAGGKAECWLSHIEGEPPKCGAWKRLKETRLPTDLGSIL